MENSRKLMIVRDNKTSSSRDLRKSVSSNNVISSKLSEPLKKAIYGQRKLPPKGMITSAI